MQGNNQVERPSLTANGYSKYDIAVRIFLLFVLLYIFVIAITAGDVEFAMGILVSLLRKKHTLEVDYLSVLKG